MNSNAEKVADEDDSKIKDAEAGLLKPADKVESDEDSTKQKRFDKKEVYKDLPNIMTLVGLYFLQGK